MAKQKTAAATGTNRSLAKGCNVLNCSCKNEYQDKKYGANKRLHNATASMTSQWRCTSCGVVR